MRKNNIKYLVAILGLASMVFSCKRDLEKQKEERTPYVIPTNNFALKDSLFGVYYTGTGVEFLTDSVAFEATFNELATYIIEIEGFTSGAMKSISVTDTVIKPDVVYWNGSSDNIYFFKRNDSVRISLKVLGNPTPLAQKTIFVSSARKFDGNLIGDFEEEAVSESLIKVWNPFFDTNGANEEIHGARINPINYRIPNRRVGDQFFGKTINVRPVEGNGVFHLWGRDFASMPDPFYIGGFNHDARRYGIETTNENTFINFYAHNNGNPTTKLVVSIFGVGGDLFEKELQVNWTGWKQISVKMSEFVQSENGELGPNFIIPEQVSRMGFAIHSGGGFPGRVAEVLIDYLIITENEPFRQK